MCTIDTSNRNAFEVYIIAGEALKIYEFYCNEIIKYVQKYFKLLLKTIVIDFIKDERGIVYFLGVKAFYPVNEEIEKPISAIDYIKDEKNINKLYKTWSCRLCQLSYPKSKITKVVTFKLLIKLKENLIKRGLGIFNHINVI